MIVSLYKTIGDEIGHVLVGYGHPDSSTSPGDAEVRDSQHGRRLMRSSRTARVGKGTLLVKKEWDLAEEWLANEEAEGRLKP